MAGTARSQSTDPFHSHRFHVIDTEGFLNLNAPAAGFNTMVAPEATISTAEYQEGINLYRKKYPGEVSFSDLTMGKGVVKNDSSLYRWMRACIENSAYRSNLIIKQYHRDDVTGLVDFRNAVAYREYRIFNAMPIRVKMSSDFDTTNSDIAIEDLDVAYEYFLLFENGQETQRFTPA